MQPCKLRLCQDSVKDSAAVSAPAFNGNAGYCNACTRGRSRFRSSRKHGARRVDRCMRSPARAIEWGASGKGGRGEVLTLSMNSNCPSSTAIVLNLSLGVGAASGPRDNESRAREMHNHVADERIVPTDRYFINR